MMSTLSFICVVSDAPLSCPCLLLNLSPTTLPDAQMGLIQNSGSGHCIILWCFLHNKFHKLTHSSALSSLPSQQDILVFMTDICSVLRHKTAHVVARLWSSFITFDYYLLLPCATAAINSCLLGPCMRCQVDVCELTLQAESCCANVQPCTAEPWIYFDNWLKEGSVSPHNFSNVSICISVLWSWEYQQIFCPLSEKFIHTLSHSGCFHHMCTWWSSDHHQPPPSSSVLPSSASFWNPLFITSL